jgi:hypothetical protein
MSTKMNIMDTVAAGLAEGTKIVFDFAVTPAEIAEALDGKVWTSKDGKVTNIYLKVRSGKVDKVWLWKKDDVTYYFSSEKNTYYPSLLAEASAWRKHLESRVGNLNTLAVVEQMEAAEAEAAKALTEDAAAVAAKIAAGSPVTQDELLAVGFELIGTREGVSRYDAPAWFAEIKDLTISFKDGLAVEYDATAAEMERINAFLGRFA